MHFLEQVSLGKKPQVKTPDEYGIGFEHEFRGDLPPPLKVRPCVNWRDPWAAKSSQHADKCYPIHGRSPIRTACNLRVIDGSSAVTRPGSEQFSFRFAPMMFIPRAVSGQPPLLYLDMEKQ